VLYGWNTLGAVAGALLGETVLIGALGITGAALCAGAFNLVAAAGALAVAGRIDAVEPPREAPGGGGALSLRAKRILAASFLAGGTLLALEVVWFRFLQLFLPGTTLTFCVMLSIVLAGIGLGGLAASHAFGRRKDLQRFAPGVALNVDLNKTTGGTKLRFEDLEAGDVEAVLATNVTGDAGGDDVVARVSAEAQAFAEGISSIELGRRLGVRQATAWMMKHKLMQAPGSRAADREATKPKLGGRVEMDDAYLGG